MRRKKIHAVEGEIELTPPAWVKLHGSPELAASELQQGPEPSFEQKLAAYEAGRSLPAEPVQTIDVRAVPAPAAEPQPAPVKCAAPLPQVGKPRDPGDESIPVAYHDGTVIQPQRRRARG